MHYKTQPLSYLRFAIMLTVGCATAPTQPKPGLARQPDHCLPATVDEYCASRKCPTYADELAFAHEEHKNRFFYSLGTCGDYRFVTTMEGMGAGTDYFDSSGRLVGIATAADTPMCNGEMSNVIGVGSDCTELVVESGGHQAQ